MFLKRIKYISLPKNCFMLSDTSVNAYTLPCVLVSRDIKMLQTFDNITPTTTLRSLKVFFLKIRIFKRYSNIRSVSSWLSNYIVNILKYGNVINYKTSWEAQQVIISNRNNMSGWGLLYISFTKWCPFLAMNLWMLLHKLPCWNLRLV